jgi:hypothetical protein
LIDGNDDTAWSTDLGPGQRHHDSQVVMKFATNGWESADGTFLKVWLKFRHGGEDAHGRDNNFLGRFRLAITTAEDPHADPLPAGVREALAVAKEKRTAKQQQLIFAEWRKSVPELKEINEAMAGLWKDYPEGESVLNLAQRDPEWHRADDDLRSGELAKTDKES